MDDLDTYIEERKQKSPSFSRGFDRGYEQFKIGAVLPGPEVVLGMDSDFQTSV